MNDQRRFNITIEESCTSSQEHSRQYVLCDPLLHREVVAKRGYGTGNTSSGSFLANIANCNFALTTSHRRSLAVYSPFLQQTGDPIKFDENVGVSVNDVVSVSATPLRHLRT